jgi:NADPH:quinone reductase-like Zn-dependent oxidoreductase
VPVRRHAGQLRPVDVMLRVGEQVLVVGASGGVSVAAIQLTAHAGARMIATRGTA